MRSKDRIKPFLNLIEEIWTKYPDLRFGQIIENVRLNEGKDLFYIEDDDFLEYLKEAFL